MKRKLSITLPSILLTAILLFTLLPPVASATGDEIIGRRTQASKTYYLGNNRYAMDVSVGVAHYKDAQGKWQNINNEITSGVMNEADYTFRLLQNTFNAGQVVEFAREDEYVRLQPMALEWTNDISQIQQISMPQAVAGTTTNTPVQLLPGVDSQQGKVLWLNAYGTGRDFSWATTPTRLQKVLTIPSLANLPAPPAYIISGGNPVLRLNMIFAPSSGIDIYVDGQLWDKSSTIQTFGRIEFRKDGETLWDFAPLLYWDSSVEGNQGESIKTLRKAGNKLYIEIRVPYSWLQTAVYPVYIDAPLEVQVGVSEDDGYQMETGAMDITGIIVSHGSSTDEDERAWGGYRFVSAEFPAQGTTIDVAYLRAYLYDSGYDDANFNLHFEELAAPAAFTTDDNNITGRDITETSVEWIADSLYTGDLVNSPSLCGVDSPAQELFDAYSPTTIVVIIRPNQDEFKYCWFRSWDYTGNDQGAILHLEWEEVGVVAPTVVTNPANNVEETAAQMSGNITATGGENADEQGFEWGTSTGSYSANYTYEGDFGVGVFLYTYESFSPGTLYFYRAYAHNSEGWGYGAEVTFLTKPNPASSFASTDNGTSWISLSWANGTGMDYVEIRYAEGSAPSDNVSGTLGYWGSGTSANVTGLDSGTTYFFTIFTHASDGGLWSTSDNSPTCQDTTDGVVAPTVVTNAATSVEETTATLQGNITATGGDNATARRFQWGTNTGAYTDNWTEYGNYGTGNFTHGITGLTEGEGYYYIASANNSAGWGEGSEIFFITKPDPATSFTSTDNGTTWVSLSWNNGAGMDYVEIRYAEGSAPSDNVSGTLGYWGSGTSANVTGLDSGTTYFFTIFTHATENSEWSTADDNPSCQDTTLIAPPTVTSDSATSVTHNSAFLSGDITDTGGESANTTGFQWGTTSGIYTDNWTQGGSFGVENFTHTATGLSEDRTYFWRAIALNSAGWGYSAERSFATLTAPPPVLDPRDPDLVYLEFRPDLDEVRIRGNASIPTSALIGIFFGYSLPVWVKASDEELYFLMCVPDRWNGSSDILVHVKTATSDNQTGNTYELELAWDKVTPNVVEAIPTGAPYTASANRTVDSELTYACYRDWFVLDYDIEADDPVVVDDTLALRFRRYGDSDNLTSELIVFELAVLFARGDLLGDPPDFDDFIMEEDMEELGIQFGAFNNILGEWSAFFLIVFGLIFIIGLSFLAFWRFNALLFMLVAGASLIFGLYWYDAFTDNLGLTLGLMMLAYAFVCIAFAFRCLFWRGTISEE